MALLCREFFKCEKPLKMPDFAWAFGCFISRIMVILVLDLHIGQNKGNLAAQSYEGL